MVIAEPMIADRPEIAFAHKSGFIAKTKERLSIDDLIDLVSKAVIGSSEIWGKVGIR